MKEYIDRGALLKELERFPHLKTAESVVRSMPKADVVEVRRGEWKHRTLFGGDVVECSECYTLGSPVWKRCPYKNSTYGCMPKIYIDKLIDYRPKGGEEE